MFIRHGKEYKTCNRHSSPEEKAKRAQTNKRYYVKNIKGKDCPEQQKSPEKLEEPEKPKKSKKSEPKESKGSTRKLTKSMNENGYALTSKGRLTRYGKFVKWPKSD
jgi:hypothetical protein